MNKAFVKRNFNTAYNAASDSVYTIHNGHRIALPGRKMTIVTIQSPMLVTWPYTLRIALLNVAKIFIFPFRTASAFWQHNFVTKSYTYGILKATCLSRVCVCL